MRFVVCKHCKYHMEPRLTVDGLCVNAAKCEGRLREKKRLKADLRRTRTPW